MLMMATMTRTMTMTMAVSRSTTTITRSETAELLRQGRRSAGYALAAAAAAAVVVAATTSPTDAKRAMSSKKEKSPNYCWRMAVCPTTVSVEAPAIANSSRSTVSRRFHRDRHHHYRHWHQHGDRCCSPPTGPLNGFAAFRAVDHHKSQTQPKQPDATYVRDASINSRAYPIQTQGQNRHDVCSPNGRQRVVAITQKRITVNNCYAASWCETTDNVASAKILRTASAGF
jgi:hypothetical protein